MRTLLLIHVASTLSMTGLIWFVQIVHYPLFSAVGEATFTRYETKHQRLTSFVVGPLMLAELSTLVLLLGLAPSNLDYRFLVMGGILLAIIWISTIMLQMPLHQELSNAFHADHHQSLVLTNWIRTIAWTLRSLTVLLILPVNGLPN